MTTSWGCAAPASEFPPTFTVICLRRSEASGWGRSVKELCSKYGPDQVKAFIRGWLNFSERLVVRTIQRILAVTLTNCGAHDPVEALVPKGIPVTAAIRIDPENGMIEIDLTESRLWPKPK